MNAVQACGTEGEVIYRTHYDLPNKMVNILVSDTGYGIPDEIKAEIFTPFYTTRTEGTGLGLAIVKDIVEMHKGEIKVRNNPCKGCTFQIDLHTDWIDLRI